MCIRDRFNSLRTADRDRAGQGAPPALRFALSLRNLIPSTIFSRVDIVCPLVSQCLRNGWNAEIISVRSSRLWSGALRCDGGSFGGSGRAAAASLLASIPADGGAKTGEANSNNNYDGDYISWICHGAVSYTHLTLPTIYSV
eukprot:TRINITY_DN22685_c0_g1_i1.p1 TRINITY_DN22685_c0_g1~~TRINITY_DN22685_c0_g1_i1.p1  ORF type:complete len:142 (+),score=14.50 TRINITY_DN22685_c0_g1_i1:142-567(+)